MGPKTKSESHTEDLYLHDDDAAFVTMPLCMWPRERTSTGHKNTQLESCKRRSLPAKANTVLSLIINNLHSSELTDSYAKSARLKTNLLFACLAKWQAHVQSMPSTGADAVENLRSIDGTALDPLVG